MFKVTSLRQSFAASHSGYGCFGEFVVAARILDIARFNEALLMVRRHFPLRPVLEGPQGFQLGSCDVFKRSGNFSNMLPGSVLFQPECSGWPQTKTAGSFDPAASNSDPPILCR